MQYPKYTSDAILGLGCGDAFGAPFEFHAGAKSFATLSIAEERYIHGFDDCRLTPRRVRTPGLYTDDTQQALILLWIWAQMVDRGHDPLNADNFSKLFLDVCRRMANSKVRSQNSFGLHRGTGKNFRDAILKLQAPNTAGLGGAMRIGPVATLLPDIDTLVPWVVAVTSTTTSSPMALAATVMVAVESWLLSKGQQVSFTCPKGLTGQLQEAWVLLDRAYRVCLNRGPAALVEFAEKTGLSNRKLNNPADGFALTGVSWILYCLHHASSFSELVHDVCLDSSDTDTVAAIAGCFGVLKFGSTSIPTWMTDQLIGVEHLQDVTKWHPIQTEIKLLELDAALISSIEASLLNASVSKS